MLCVVCVVCTSVSVFAQREQTSQVDQKGWIFSEFTFSVLMETVNAWRCHVDSLHDSQYQHKYKLRESTGSQLKGDGKGHNNVLLHVTRLLKWYPCFCHQETLRFLTVFLVTQSKQISETHPRKHPQKSQLPNLRDTLGVTRHMKGHISRHAP